MPRSKDNQYVRYRRCIYCDAEASETLHVSARGVCANCRREHTEAAMDQIAAKDGPIYLRKVAAQFRVALRDYREAFGTDPII